MRLNELQALVGQGEGQFLEFKLKANYPEKIVKEVVAFANGDGGHLFIGVNDDGRISGLKFPEDDKYVIENAIKSHIKPGIRYQFNIIPISRKRGVLHFKVFKFKRKPIYYLFDLNKRGKAYVRINDKSVQASREFIEILEGLNSNKSSTLRLGEEEYLLFKQIEKYGKVSISKFVESSGLSRYRASQILIKLVVSNILKIEIGEKEDLYSMK